MKHFIHSELYPAWQASEGEGKGKDEHVKLDFPPFLCPVSTACHTGLVGQLPLRASGDVLGHTMYIKTSFRTNASNLVMLIT